MLPMGDNTVRAVNGLITGLPNTDIYENYHPMSFKQPYAMGIAQIMKQLGYKTVFGMVDMQLGRMSKILL